MKNFVSPSNKRLRQPDVADQNLNGRVNRAAQGPDVVQNIKRSIRTSARRVLVVSSLVFPFAAAAASQSCSLDTRGTGEGMEMDSGTDSPLLQDGGGFPETEPFPDVVTDVVDEPDVAGDAQADADAEVGADSGPDAPVDAGFDADAEVDADAETEAGVDSGDAEAGADAGTDASLSNDPSANVCIHWLTSQLGTTLGFASDNHVCEPKPLSSVPIKSGIDMYFWSKDGSTNNEILFSTVINPTSYSKKCSSYSTPPNKAEMETELFSSGYATITNGGVLPQVKLTDGSCPNGTAYVIHLNP